MKPVPFTLTGAITAAVLFQIPIPQDTLMRVSVWVAGGIAVWIAGQTWRNGKAIAGLPGVLSANNDKLADRMQAAMTESENRTAEKVEAMEGRLTTRIERLEEQRRT